MWPDDILSRAKSVVDLYAAAGKRIVTAESCTGGLIAGALTEISGSSAVVERGFVTYSNEAKHDMLNVLEASFAQYGAVSEQVAQQMAMGALERSRAEVAVSVTGVAGPSGGSDLKPVGTVCFGVAQKGAEPRTQRLIFSGQDRLGVRLETVRHALTLFQHTLSS